MGAAIPIAIGAGVVGSALSAYGQNQQGEEAAAAARENARLARIAAADAVARGMKEGAKARAAGSRAVGEAKAMIAAGGIDPSVGSPLALLAASRGNAELDALTLENNAAREAWGQRQAAKGLEAQAGAYRRAGRMGAVGTLLGGLGGAAGMMDRAGYFGGSSGPDGKALFRRYWGA